jgi:3-hydroxybutyryl-CoA dehydratase
MARLEDYKVGDFVEDEVVISEELVNNFAKLTGDFNPLHLDEEYASRSIFKKRISHGLLPASFIGKLLGTRLPGPGTIYLYQNVEFKAPVFVGDTIVVHLEIIEIKEKTGIITFRTLIRNLDNLVVMDGEAAILFRPVKDFFYKN